MKKTNLILILALILSINFIAAQEEDSSKFSFGFSLTEQLVGKDSGENIEGILGYSINSNMSIHLLAANASMRSKEFDNNYKLEKYAIQVNYDFAKSENSKVESIFGFSYINFDKKILPDDNNGFGIDLGIQTILGLKNKLNYGFKIVSTFSNFSPGGILNAGIIFRYNF